ncbi:MAG: 6,7-dimethyl-8-ribityllumazine synthase [Actinobacteria bacterium]|nr:6,7-dimethyl-8-ribityllumazine synthase [Actinomycetota bacterium]
MKRIEGKLDATSMSFAIVVSRYNEFLTSRLVDGAVDCLVRHNCDEKNISIAWVPGAFEIPPAAKIMAESKKYDAVICLGAVLKGDTSHNVYIANEVIKGIAQIGLSTSLPVIFGVITPDTLEQAIERAGTKLGNSGWSAALNAIEMVSLFKVISSSEK